MNLFLQLTQRSELSPTDSKKWTFLFDKIGPKGLIFSDMTQRTEHFFEYDSKNWTLFLTWVKELNFSLQVTQRSELLIWQNMTQRFDFFWYDSKNRTLLNVTQRIEPFFINMIQRIEPSSQKDSKNWFFSQFFQRFEPFLTWLTELSLFLNDMTHWDWTLLFNISQRKLLIFCMTQRFSSFLQNVWLKEWIDRSWKIWLWELKILKEKRTLRIEPFQKLTRWIEPSVLHDPKNWTFFSYINSKDWTFS